MMMPTLRRALVFSLSMVGFLSIQLSGQLGVIPSALFLFAAVAAWWWDAPRVTFARWSTAWTVLTVIAFTATLARIAIDFSGFLTHAMNFALFLAAAKLFQLAEDKDYTQSMALSLLMLASGSALNQGLSFGVMFAAYVILSTIALTVQHLIVEIHDRGGGRAHKQKMDRPVLVATTSLAVVVFLGSLAFFFLMPRIGFGAFMQQSRGGVMSAGFGNEVELGQHGTVRDNDEIVMRVVFPEGPPDVPSGLYFRGLSLDRYSGRNWRDTDDRLQARGGLVTRFESGQGYGVEQLPEQLRSSATWEDTIEGTWVTEINLEPLASDVLFGNGFIRAISLPNRATDLPSSITDRTLTADTTGEVNLQERSDLGVRYIVYSIDNSLNESDPALRNATYAGGSPTIEGRLTALWESLSIDRPFTMSGEDLQEMEARTRDDEQAQRLIATARYYLQLPTGQVTPRMRRYLDELRAGAPDTVSFAIAARDRLRTMEYTTDLPAPSGPDANLIDEFLFEWQRGHCEYYATALVVLLRAEGVPARIVNGFLGATFNPVGDYYYVTQGNAHSWVEFYVPGEGWLRLDPTPAGAPDMSRSGAFGQLALYVDALRLRWFRWVVEYDAEKQFSLARDALSTIASEAGDDVSLGDVNEKLRTLFFRVLRYWRVVAILGLLFMLGVGTYQNRAKRRVPWGPFDLTIAVGWGVLALLVVDRTWPGPWSVSAVLTALLPPLLVAAVAYQLRRLLLDESDGEVGRSRGDDAVSVLYARLLAMAEYKLSDLPRSLTPRELELELPIEEGEFRSELRAFIAFYERVRYAGYEPSPTELAAWRKRHKKLVRRIRRAKWADE